MLVLTRHQGPEHRSRAGRCRRRTCGASSCWCQRSQFSNIAGHQPGRLRELPPRSAGLLSEQIDLRPGRYSATIAITGVDRQPWDDESFRQHLAGGAEASPLLSRLHYHRGDVTDAATLRAFLGDRDAPAVAYLALPPHVFPGAVQALGAAPLAAGSRIVIEKPFGNDLASARQLNALVHEVVPEDAVFRVDHFLGKQTVQNILGLRLANRIFEAAWNAQHIESVDIIWDETLGLEGRAGYYDAAGALRDMIQTLEVNLNGAGDPIQLERAGMTADLAPQLLSAYARLLLDIFDGDPILSIRADEAEEAWRVIEPIIDAWTQGATPLVEYSAGSSEPGDRP